MLLASTELSQSLQILAEKYIGARQKSGESLLEAAGYLAQARSKAEYGEWYAFLEATRTSPSAAEQLLNIHERASLDHMFAEAVKSNWLSLTTAALLARPNTPQGVIDQALNGNDPPTRRDIQSAIGNKRNPDPDQDLDEEDELEQIEERRYDGWPMDTPPEEDRKETRRRQQIAIITGSSESNEWYTPAHIIEQARAALGGIDFDPASSAAANVVVQAEAYCTIAENGYAQPWYGKVWLNPPYGKEEGETTTNAVRWSRKLIAEYEEGRVEAAILLVKAALGYNWFEELWRLYPTCLLRERLSFVRPDGSDDGQSKHATALLYIGPDAARFRAAFQSLGRIVLPDE